MSPEGMLAGHVIGVPTVCHLWGPTGTAETGPGAAALTPDVPAPVRERLGIPADLELLKYVIDPCPQAVAPPTRATRLPVRYVPFNGSGAMPGWAAQQPQRPRVCLVWSNSLTRIFGQASFVVPHVVRACAGLGVELLVALNDADADLLGAVPDNVHVLRNFPVHLLMSTCSVVVNHGGAGSMMTALAAGVPQLTLPLGPVLSTMARRLAATDAAIDIPGYAADADSVAAALDALLYNDKHAVAARKLAEDNANRPNAIELVGTLEALAGGARCA
jgi:UDP:flavonoid glycosyltransferase YjiC (YdhE family)